MADGKQPYAIARVDGAPTAFAGLWESWRDPAGETLRTFTILTTTANDDMARLHDRMPVILEEAAWPVWLGGRRSCGATKGGGDERGAAVAGQPGREQCSEQWG